MFVCVCVHVSLFMWVQPESTRKLYICLWVAFIGSCVLPYQLMGFMIGEGRTQHAQTELLYPCDVLLSLKECIYLHAIQRAQTNAFIHHLRKPFCLRVRGDCRPLISSRSECSRKIFQEELTVNTVVMFIQLRVFNILM